MALQANPLAALRLEERRRGSKVIKLSVSEAGGDFIWISCGFYGDMKSQ